ncbi:MAG: serine hydrolase, partial [Mycobacterium sp.]|nr:serine hydrolase [Mycobacterium sp.]
MSHRHVRRAAAVALVATLTACGSPAPRTESPAADAPPQLIPAMPLPDNAVANAVAKLDGIAEELMNSSGIPGMAIAV